MKFRPVLVSHSEPSIWNGSVSLNSCHLIPYLQVLPAIFGRTRHGTWTLLQTLSHFQKRCRLPDFTMLPKLDQPYLTATTIRAYFIWFPVCIDADFISHLVVRLCQVDGGTDRDLEGTYHNWCHGARSVSPCSLDHASRPGMSHCQGRLTLTDLVDLTNLHSLVQHVREVGDYLYSGLETLSKSVGQGKILNLRGKNSGTFIAFDNPTSKARDEFVNKMKLAGVNMGGSVHILFNLFLRAEFSFSDLGQV